MKTHLAPMPLGRSKATEESVSYYIQILFLIKAIKLTREDDCTCTALFRKPNRRMTLSVIDIMAKRSGAYHGAEEGCVYWAEI